MDFDRAYANGDFIPGAADYPPRWAALAAAWRAALGGRAQRHAYGSGARQVYDLFLPEGHAKGCVIFIHGGYWLRFDQSFWSHLAAGPLARGWACAMPGYTLAPQARIAAMTQEIATVVRDVAGRIDGPLVVTGHSAGGHLSARMGCSDLDLPRVARVVPISPLADLAPLAQTAMQKDLALDEAEIAAESPALLRLRPGTSAHVWVGGSERPAFLWQARLLAEEWGCDWTVDPGRHHFDVIDTMADPESPLTRALLDGV